MNNCRLLTLVFFLAVSFIILGTTLNRAVAEPLFKQTSPETSPALSKEGLPKPREKITTQNVTPVVENTKRGINLSAYIKDFVQSRDSSKAKKDKPKYKPIVLDVSGKKIPPVAIPGQTKAVLSVIVSAQPAEHLNQTLERLRAVGLNQGVTLGQVIMVGFERQYDQEIAKLRVEIGSQKIPSSMEEYRKAVEEVKQQRKKNKGSVPPDLKALVDKLKSSDPAVRKEGQLESLNAKLPASSKIIQHYKLTPKGKIVIEDFLARYRITSSPAWIVRYQGYDHVFEGQYDPAVFFNQSGLFTKEAGGEQFIQNGPVFYANSNVSLRRDNPLILRHKARPTNVLFRIDPKWRQETSYGLK